ncbi:MAG: ClpXP protease specificity-enhancing factor SspB [Hyphomicrobiales bacterium]|nr:ClpXP protease specificity-enhancing factor SspB [Hyphomicrobiales bacterium]
MAEDLIRYDTLAQEALRGVVRTVLERVAESGLPGEHHLFIAFDTKAEGVDISDRLRQQYPDEMTVVLQYQFWDLELGEDYFEVKLAFNNIPERLVVPFDSIKAFYDPSVQFGLQFGAPGAANDEDPEEAALPAIVNEDGTGGGMPAGVGLEQPAETPDTRAAAAEESAQPAAKVVELDAFRKK